MPSSASQLRGVVQDSGLALAGGVGEDLLGHALVQPHRFSDTLDGVAVVEAEGVDAGTQRICNLTADAGAARPSA